MSMKHLQSRQRWFPGGSTMRQYDEANLEVGVINRDLSNISNPVHVVGYFGNAYRRPTFNYVFKSMERAEAFITEQVEIYKQVIADKAARKAQRVAAPRGMEEGDILRCSWGYDQTNIDYYQVTKVFGKNKVEIREVGIESEETGWMQGKSVPRPGHFIGEPMIKIARDGQVRIASYANAYVMKPEVVAGAKVYRPSHWTAYA